MQESDELNKKKLLTGSSFFFQLQG